MFAKHSVEPTNGRASGEVVDAERSRLYVYKVPTLLR